MYLIIKIINQLFLSKVNDCYYCIIYNLNFYYYPYYFDFDFFSILNRPQYFSNTLKFY